MQGTANGVPTLQMSTSQVLTPGFIFNMKGEAGEGSEGLRHSKHTVVGQTLRSELLGCCDGLPYRFMFSS